MPAVATTTDSELLSRLAQDARSGAMAELLGRHADWVYCAALRMVRDPALAADVKQAVFILLAEKARVLSRRGGDISGWLFTTTRYVARRAMRSERRRRHQEQRAAM